MQIRDDVESQSLLNGISWLPSMQWDAKSATPTKTKIPDFSYFHCHALDDFGYVDHFYGWVYLSTSEVMFGSRELIDQQYFGQFWFFGAYMGLLANTLGAKHSEEKIVGMELTGSKFGQFTFSTYLAGLMSGASLMYTKALFSNSTASIFLSLPSLIHHPVVGLGGSYIVHPNFRLKYKYLYFTFDKSVAIELQGEFILSKKLTHDVFRNNFLRPPEWYLPFNSSISNDFNGTSSNKKPHSKNYNFYEEFPRDFDWDFNKRNAGSSSRGQRGNRHTFVPPNSVSSVEKQFADFIKKTEIEVRGYNAKELESAFRRNARFFHPDTLPPELKNGPKEAREAAEKAREEQFKKFQNCYEQLKRRKS